VTAQGASAGTATITVSSPATTNYTAASATYSLTVNPKTNALNPLSYIDTGYLSGTIGSNTPIATGADGILGLYPGGSSSINVTDYNNAKSGYHMPTSDEWLGIIGTAAPNNLFTNTGNASQAVAIGSSTGLMNLTDFSYWDPSTVGTGVAYAVRFIGTDNCSVWKYEWINSTPNNQMTISSALIDYIGSQAAALTWLAANKTSLSWDITRTYSSTGYCNLSGTTMYDTSNAIHIITASPPPAGSNQNYRVGFGYNTSGSVGYTGSVYQFDLPQVMGYAVILFRD
jgi:hypothetical protein